MLEMSLEIWHLIVGIINLYLPMHTLPLRLKLS